MVSNMGYWSEPHLADVNPKLSSVIFCVITSWSPAKKIASSLLWKGFQCKGTGTASWLTCSCCWDAIASVASIVGLRSPWSSCLQYMLYCVWPKKCKSYNSYHKMSVRLTTINFYLWAFVVSVGTTYWMAIPLLQKCLTIIVNIIKEKCVQQPKVWQVLGIEHMHPFESSEKCPLASGKLWANLDPQMLNMTVLGRTSSTHD